MVQAVVEQVRIAGIRAAVPRIRHCFTETPEPFTVEDAVKLHASTGVYARRVLPAHLCASDMAVCAAEGLLAQLGWAPASVEVLIFVSQDVDYNLPATACVMQQRLGLPVSAAAFDVNLGCSGFIYGTWIASRLLGSASARRALVVCGDVSTRHLVPDDRATRPLFGDAGGAIALEQDTAAAPMYLCLGTDGRGAPHICVKAGGRRHALTPGLVARTPDEEAGLFAEARLRLNGAEVFAFTLRAVPPLVREVLAHAGLEREAFDHVVMHQANKFMLDHLRKKTGFSEAQFLVDMEEFGNTSSASIPLAISHRLGGSLSSGCRKMLLAGFGVGWSWGALVADIGPIPAPEVAEIPDNTEPMWLE